MSSSSDQSEQTEQPLIMAPAKVAATKTCRAPRKSDNPKKVQAGWRPNKIETLNARNGLKIYTKRQSLHFVSAKILWEALSGERPAYYVTFGNTREYGFFPATFTTNDRSNLVFKTVTFNLHFHYITKVTSDEYGKTFGQLVPYTLDESHPLAAEQRVQQINEAHFILLLVDLLGIVMAKSAEYLPETKGFMKIKSHSAADLTKFKLKLPKDKVDGSACFNPMDLLRKVDDNHDVCIQVAGGWVIPSESLEYHDTYFAGVSFKMLPWLHEWYYTNPDTTPKLPMKRPAPKKSIKKVSAVPNNQQELEEVEIEMLGVKKLKAELGEEIETQMEPKLSDHLEGALEPEDNDFDRV